MYLFQTVSDPGDLDQFTDNRYEHGAVTLFFRDRQGETIHSAISRIKEYTSENPLEDGEYRLAGGVVGVLAAVNEIIFSSQVEAIALALVVLVALCSLTYRSMSAGMLFMVPVILSNAVTFSAMSFLGIGMNINTVPIAALGIGLGVDYGLYIADRMKEEHLLGRTPEQCVTSALSSSGYGVVVTAVVLVACVLIWGLSSLRFQAEMGILMAIWLGFSALSALLLVPSMIYVFKPKFIFGNTKKPVLTSSVI
jgi:predicted RND superfamily exporter protein